MASLWLKLFSISLTLCFNCFAKPIRDEEAEFECVSIYKQYALQHPLMKNHQIQTKPSQELLSMLSPSNDDTITETLLKGLEECPEGLVPIYKPKTNLTNNYFNPQQFTKAGSLMKEIYKKKRKNKPISRKHRKGIHRPRIFTEIKERFAIVRAFENTTKRWRGAQALFNINKPRVFRKNQFSKAWIWLNYIHGNSMTSIQFGWAVHTALYPDNRPRLTTLWMSDEHPKGCYNALCPRGYVQIHRSIYPGLVYNHVTLPGRKHKTVHLSVAEDPVTKNWVLTIGSTLIGYWPRQNQLVLGAAEVYFGGFTGIVGWASQYTISPPMGTGQFPTKDLSRSCFMKQLKYVTSDYTLVDINSNEVETYVDSPKCYGVMYLKYVDFSSRETLTFGGPGGHC